MAALEHLREELEKCGQGHIFANSLVDNADGEHSMAAQLRKVNFTESLKRFDAARQQVNDPIPDAEIQPVSNVLEWNAMEAATKNEIRELGLKALSDSTVAVVILSGGQGTRLGFDGPKGMYDLGLPSGRSIFEIHVDRLNAARRLASNSSSSALPSVPLYIMTSEINTVTIKKYFESNDYFGYPSKDVFFFEQGLEPCVDFDGRIILERHDRIAMAPDGNGGIYNALQVSGAAEDMRRRGVKHLHVYGIDNILTKSADPAFIGACIQKGAQVGNKVCWRANKSEKVGVTVDHGGKMLILEYSEISHVLADAVDDNGKLIYGAGNICNHYLHIDFIFEQVFPSLTGIYHLAKKKIPYFDCASGTQVVPTENNGYKLEMYIFDVFPLASSWLVMDVVREDEFAPVKNSPDAVVDSPRTARELLSAQSRRWVEACGGEVQGDGILEISPRVSYEGEGLEYLRNNSLATPKYIH